jgi:hypothetical protein
MPLAAVNGRQSTAGRIDSGVAELEERHKAALAVRRHFERQWTLNIAMYLGQQWVRIDGQGLIFNVADDERVTLTDNRIRPAIRVNIAKMTKTQPTWVGVPKDGSDDEVARARLRTVVFEHYFRELSMRRRIRMWLWWREMTGAGFLKTVWDQSKGRGVDVMARDGVVVLDANNGPIMPDRVQASLPEEMRAGLETKRVTFGDVVASVKSPFEIAVDPLATSEGFETAEYVVESAVYSPAYLAAAFGADKDQLERDARATASPGTFEARLPGLRDYLDSNRGAAGRRGIRVNEYWSLPGVDGPTGKHVVWTDSGDKLLEEDSPYPYLPYSMLSGIPAGRFWPDSPVNDLISPQVQLNKLESQIAENAERIGNPTRMRSAESIVEEGDWLGVPGEEIVYRSVTGGQSDIPAYLQPPEMPGYVQNLVPMVVESLQTISGQHEVSNGTAPDGVTAASAISMLLEANDTQLGPEIAELAEGLTDVGRKVLWLVKAFASDERLARIAGDDSAWDIYAFRGEELGEPDADEVEIGSGMPESKAAKQAAIQFVLNLMIQNGQALPPRELRKVLRDYEVGGMESFLSGLSRDVTQCQDENRRMLAGEEIPVNSWDAHETHVEEHNDVRKSARYAEMIRKPGGEIVAMLFEAHVQGHQQILQDQANQAAQAAMLQQQLASGDPNSIAAAAASAPEEPLPSAAEPPPLTGG